MPRFPISAQRTAAPNAFSTSPRARPAAFGSGLGEAVAGFGVEAARLGRTIGQRQEREAEQKAAETAAEEARTASQAAREAARVRMDATRERLESEAGTPEGEAPPPVSPAPDGDSLAREQSRFEGRASDVEVRYAGDPRQSRVAEALAVEAEAWNRRLIGEEGRRRLGRDLATAEAVVGLWSQRVAEDPARFETALEELLGPGGEAGEGDGAGLMAGRGLMAGLGLRPEALAAWEERTLERLLAAQTTGDPEGLLADLEAGRWRERLPEDRQETLLEDARDALALRDRKAAAERGQTAAGTALGLSRALARGEAGFAEIRRAERAGRITPEQASGLTRQAQEAGIAAQTEQAANDELALSLSGGIGFDADNPQNRAAAERFYEIRYSAALRAGADAGTQEEIAAAVAGTGYLPRALGRDLTGALASDDAARQAAGAELYGRLLESSPALLERALDPETRARGGVLSHWLAGGLSPAAALARMEEELAFLDDDSLGVLQRDLSALFFGDEPGRHVSGLIDFLERNYLDDLGRGLRPRAARARLRSNVGRVTRKFGLLKRVLATRSAWSGDGHAENAGAASLLHTVGRFSAKPGGSQGAAGSKGAAGFYGPFGNPLDDDEAAAVALELERAGAELTEGARTAADSDSRGFWRKIATNFPGLAARFGYSMLSIGEGVNYLGEIREKGTQSGIRAVDIMHPVHGLMTVRQQRDITTERYRNLDATFWDREKREWVTEKLPSKRFTLPPETDGATAEVDNRLAADGEDWSRTPPLVPPDRQDFESGGFGEQGVPDLPLATGGPPADLGPMTDPDRGFALPEDQGATSTVFPDQSGELPQSIILEIANLDDEIKNVRRILISPDRLIAPPSRPGNAPIGDDGYPIELHHVRQDDEYVLVEMTRTDHRLGKNYKKNHPNTGRSKTKVSRKKHNSIRRKLYRLDFREGRFEFFSDPKHPYHPNNLKRRSFPDHKNKK